MSRVGFVMLVHDPLDRAGQVARYWADSGCPVVIHVDAGADPAACRRLTESMSGHANIRFVPRRRCDWGTWPIVAATLDAARLMLEAFPAVNHVFLASGSCLPLRPVADLAGHLARSPRTDFIESVTTQDTSWTRGGLESERFTLRFPFSWRRQRGLFDAYVRLQRRLGYRRPMPEGLVPHLGSQWWCLTRTTLAAILDDPDRPRLDRFFRHVWIPDESYFQTLVRRHSRQIESCSLTLARFDAQGRPFVFYDDHLGLLQRSESFVARKIWPQAEGLYRSFLSAASGATRADGPGPARIDRLFAQANEQRLRGRAGLRMQSRFPHAGVETGKTCAPYSVLQGFDALYQDFAPWLERAAGVRAHGHLFARGRVAFAGGADSYRGALSDSAALRDHDPEGFLINLIWNSRGEYQSFQFGPADRQEIGGFLAADANARIAIITGAWAIGLFRSGRPFPLLRAEAARLQAIEARHLEILRASWARARVRIWTLAEVLEAPMAPLHRVIDEIEPFGQRRLAETPRLADLAGFATFLQKLRNDGMNPYLLHDFPLDTPATAPTPVQAAE